ncbi:MAG: hypothetical protein R3185_04415, partial [Candidatus Thermoplasmatota archaeon]|nr:hypothetical protein [Candidatus Thermoplasmatota archaeon]
SGELTADNGGFTLHPGWWNHGFNSADPPSTPPNSGSGKLVWYRVSGSSAAYDVDVDAYGTLVGGVDVFEFEDDSRDGITQDCPQGHVAPLYPTGDDATLQYITRVASYTVGSHAAPLSVADSTSNTDSVSFTLPATDEGYVLAFYIRAAVDDPGTSERLAYTVDGDAFMVKEKLDHTRTRLNGPLDYKTWQDHQSECMDRGISPMPGIPKDSQDLPTLPGADGTYQSLEGLFGTHL